MRKEDKCRIEVAGELTLERYASFVMLYMPLIGNDAATLYHTLYAIGTRKQKIRNHILLATLSKQSMEVMEKQRHILEQFLLVKTYYDGTKNSYLYQVYLPMEGSAFLRHEVFGRLYFNRMGKNVYEFNKLSFAQDVEDKSRYQDITIPFVNVLKEDWADEQEEAFTKLKPEQQASAHNEIPLRFNYDRFLDGFPLLLFPSSQRNEKNLRLIGELATIHGIDEMEMRKLVAQSMDVKRNVLNVELLKKKVRNVKGDYPVADDKDPYGLPPVRFLQRLQNGIEVSRGDKSLIEALLMDFKMKPEVVNVLIEYVLAMKNQQFPKAYVEKVASTWVRLHIDTMEKAREQIASEQEKKTKKSSVTQKQLPSWYDHQDEVTVDTEDFDEAKLLKELEELRGE